MCLSGREYLFLIYKSSDHALLELYVNTNTKKVL